MNETTANPLLGVEPARRPFDLSRLQKGVREILLALGEDPDRDGLRETPGRVAHAYAEIFQGLLDDPAHHLARTFEQGSEDLVCLRDIELMSVCEHHLLPVIGRAHVAYLPTDRRVVGLSKLARTVDVYARRPQLQERLTAQVADALMAHLHPQGVVVVVEAEHLCMTIRGVKKHRPLMRTTAYRGLYAADCSARAEVLGLLGVGSAASATIPHPRPLTPPSPSPVLIAGLGPNGVHPSEVAVRP